MDSQLWIKKKEFGHLPYYTIIAVLGSTLFPRKLPSLPQLPGKGIRGDQFK